MTTTTTRKATAAKPAAPKTPAKPVVKATPAKVAKPAKVQTEPLVGVLRDSVNLVTADWTRAIPGVHDADSKCATRFAGQFTRDRAWVENAVEVNREKGDKGEARTYWFHSCVVAKTATRPAAPAEVVIDLSQEPTAEAELAAIDAEVMPGSAKFLAEARAESELDAEATAIADKINNVVEATGGTSTTESKPRTARKLSVRKPRTVKRGGQIS